IAAGRSHLLRAPRTFRNTNTAWWDASQIYGYDERSRLRVKREPKDPARLLMVVGDGAKTEGDRQGYLPVLAPSDPTNRDWAGQDGREAPRGEYREKGQLLVLGARLGAGNRRTGQRQEELESDPRRGHQRRNQPLRLSVQLPRGVRHRLSPARPGARSDRVP